MSEVSAEEEAEEFPTNEEQKPSPFVAADPDGGGVSVATGTTATASVVMGGASSAIFLLRDYSKFGLAERVCYHFDLVEALMASEGGTSVAGEDSDEEDPREQSNKSTSGDSSDQLVRGCGVFRLLEFAPTVLGQRLTKRQKKSLRTKLQLFNQNSEQVHADGKTLCYQPQELPLRCNPSTRIYFGYEVTRIAFCVDASASLTSTFGVMGRIGRRSKNPLCPLDRLPQMARLFFQSLIHPVTTGAMVEPWKPRLSVTVLAVYPTGETSETSLLVRDYQVHDSSSAERLIQEIEEWTYSEVESGISERLSRRHPFNAWSMPIYSSNMKHILAAGDYALDILSSEARPVIVVATDGRSISCEGIVDIVLDVDRVDIPVHILDLSMSETHIIEEPIGEDVGGLQQAKPEMNFLLYDPGGTMDFPVHLTDDSESLFVVSRATGGCFLDTHLLLEAAKNTAGQHLLSDDLAQQSHSFKRRFIKMNGLQWLVLFSLSPITPTFHSSWGKLVPPVYLQKQLNKSIMEATTATGPSNLQSDVLDSSRHQSTGNDQPSKKQHLTSKSTFSIYVVSPVRVKSLILMRIKQGYRAKQYGLSTNDPDKVFIQFTLPMEFGTILHYELSYKALSSDDHMVGAAHIKIELSGDANFIQLVKHDFLKHAMQISETRPATLRNKKSSRLCQVIRSTRKEDILQSSLKPPQKWSDLVINPSSPFAKRVGALTMNQRKMHFQADRFDVVCTGEVPYGIDDQFLSQFVSDEDGVQELVESVTSWSTLAVNNGTLFVKRLTSVGSSTNYCIVELVESSLASSLYTVSVEFFGGTEPEERFRVISSLKSVIGCSKNTEVFHKQMAPFLAGHSHQQGVKKQNVEIQFHHAQWDLFRDPELFPLLTKRRVEIGNFRLLESSNDYALFAKLVPTGSIDASPDDLVQYQVAVRDAKVIIDLHMESESGVFNPYREGAKVPGRFERMVNTIRRRDQECGRALRSRTNLLRIFRTSSSEAGDQEDHRSSVARILAYSSRVTRNLRFFNRTSGANDILMKLTSDLLLSGSFGVDTEKLNIGADEIIREEEPGLWFLQQYDRHTMSIVHLSLDDQRKDELEGSCNHRSMTFFTNGIGDLYSKRDDLADDDSTESHISEYMCVSEFADTFETHQKKNFALASYLALRQAKAPEEATIDESDFAYALESLDFIEVCSILVGGTTSDDPNIGSKLLQSIKTILRPVPGDSNHFFYCGDTYDGKFLELGDDDSVDGSDGDSYWSEDVDTATQHNKDEESNEDPLQDDNTVSPHEDTVPDPIFVKFHMDGIPYSVTDLGRISKSGTLKATVSVFKGPNQSNTCNRGMSWSHKAFTSEMTALLRSYVAEETLARLRGSNDLYTTESLQLITRCLSRIQSVISFHVEVYFFISKRDTMMPAGAPAGAEAIVEDGFSLLDAELQRNVSLRLTRLTGRTFFLSCIHEEGEEPLFFWCLLSLHGAAGSIVCQIYHPDGHHMALAVLQKLHAHLCSGIHLTNQRMLLESLHRTRMASSLLVPSKTVPPKAPTQGSDALTFDPGVFACPIVFRTVFDLYQRAATNPAQVARTLEATVLHNFAVSNRPGLSVYKDESGDIFYMKIQPKGSGIDAEGQVELLVYGLGNPGPSVTNQLRILLQRRLLLIAVDMLSSVLTKNPHFKWKRADFVFLRSFEKEWMELENSEKKKPSQYRYYKFPEIVHDPCMVLLYLRQNLCGSTFFHRLNDMDQTGHNPSPSITKNDGDDVLGDGVALKMNQHEFSLYYNYAPSKLEPSFQGLSTMTEKGAEYCRQTGTGIAMIEFTLVRTNGDYVDEISFAQHAADSNKVEELPSELLVEGLSSYPIEDSDGAVCARVKITDTALNRDALHDWIRLTLNQATVAWITERWLEKSFVWVPSNHRGSAGPVSRMRKSDSIIDRLCPSLPAVSSILESSYDLPHSAIRKFEGSGVTRASSVATLTLNLLHREILSPLLEKKLLSTSGNSRQRLTLDRLSKHVRIVRLSRFANPKVVHMNWAKRGKASVKSRSSDGKLMEIIDSPVDCPEYLCFFSVSERDNDLLSIDSQLRLYREVVVHDGISEKSASIDLLEAIKTTRPKAFLRSFSFILSVKRNSRTLWTYNWNPDIAKSISSGLREADAASISGAALASATLQRRSLGILSPGKESASTLAKKQKEGATKPEGAPKLGVPPLHAPESKEKAIGYNGAPIRRIRRPTTIRRPKLIGKSVEGAAMQAVAASRKRASSNQFRNIPAQGSRQGGRAAPSRELSQAGRGRPSPPARTASDQQRLNPSQSFKEEEDEKAYRVKQDYVKLCASKKSVLLRCSSSQRNAGLQLMNLWWPRSPTHAIPSSILDILRMGAPTGWQEVCSLPPLPGQVTNIFVQTFARWIVALTPGLELVRTNSSSTTPVGAPPRSVFLCSAVRNVRGTKCCAIVKLHLMESSASHRGYSTVRAVGWMLNLPRRSKAAQRRKTNGRIKSTISMGRDAVGMDILMNEVHRSLGLERLLFDFSASMVERSVRMLDSRINFDDLLPTVKELLRRYPYERQKRMRKLNYRIFEGTIILKSYGDPFIDMFGSKALFKKLQSDSKHRDLLDCGNALCFKRPVSVKGSHSLCFLVPHENDDTKMQLVVLCRTQGVNIAHFMFREGSNVAIHILDNIAFEGAGLSLRELHYAAKSLCRDGLWNDLISRPVVPKKALSLQASPRAQPSIREKYYELLPLVHVHSLFDVTVSSAPGKTTSNIPADVYYLFSGEAGLDWRSICGTMKKSRVFSSSSLFTEDDGRTINLFHFHAHDVFLKLEVGSSGQLMQVDVIAKGLDPTEANVIFEIVVNYMLHYVWHAL